MDRGDRPRPGASARSSAARAGHRRAAAAPRRAGARRVAAADRLADATAVAVLTGQQAGLFGGPVYTLLKAITALKLADEVSRRHGVPAVAVFWIEAEDHDWDEVRSCTVLDRRPRVPDHRPARAPRGRTGAGRLDRTRRPHRRRARRARAGAAAHRVPRRAARRSPRGLPARHRDGRGVRTMDGARARRTRPRRVRRVGSGHQAGRSVTVFVRELSTPGQTADGRVEGRRRSRGAGIPRAGAGGRRQPGAVPARRIAARRSASRTASSSSATPRYAPAALAKEAGERPAGFSPSVLLRPIVQDALFPTICYVAGPSELAYLGQLRGVYEHFGVPMPLIYPRATATLLDSAAVAFPHQVSVSARSPAAAGRRRA